MGRNYDTADGPKSKDRAGSRATAGNVELPITSLLIDRALMTRPIDSGRVECLASTLSDGVALPRVSVCYVDGRGHFVTGEKRGEKDAGGFCVLKAHEAAGRVTVPCHVKVCSWENAVVAAAGANREHDKGGSPRGDDEKGKAVLMVLSVHPDWSAGKIADAAGVTPKWASQLKARWEEKRNSSEAAGVKCSHLDAGASVVGRDGKTYRIAPSAPKPANQVGMDRVRDPRGDYVGEVVPSYRKNGAAHTMLLPALTCPDCGATVRDANPWPETLLARQVHAKACELWLSRTIEAAKEPFLFRGKMLTVPEVEELYGILLRKQLPEFYEDGGPFAEVEFGCLKKAPVELLS